MNIKYSDAMLDGFAKAGEKKAVGIRLDKASGSVCAIGAVALAIDGDPWGLAGDDFVGSEAWVEFMDQYGIAPSAANNGHTYGGYEDVHARDCDDGRPGLPIDVIAGMFRAIGY